MESMKTTTMPVPASSPSFAHLAPPPAAAAAAAFLDAEDTADGTPEPRGTPKRGRPSAYSGYVTDILCALIRQKGLSDSAAAAAACLHPSTVSRWKREYPDFAILLRSSREIFRAEHLGTILEAARAGGSGWRAATWLLERTFPEDYAPRAREPGAVLQERFDAVCASEEEGSELELPGSTKA